jgi:hypothetical protein
VFLLRAARLTKGLTHPPPKPVSRPAGSCSIAIAVYLLRLPLLRQAMDVEDATEVPGEAPCLHHHPRARNTRSQRGLADPSTTL